MSLVSFFFLLGSHNQQESENHWSELHAVTRADSEICNKNWGKNWMRVACTDRISSKSYFFAFKFNICEHMSARLKAETLGNWRCWKSLGCVSFKGLGGKPNGCWGSNSGGQTAGPGIAMNVESSVQSPPLCGSEPRRSRDVLNAAQGIFCKVVIKTSFK